MIAVPPSLSLDKLTVFLLLLTLSDYLHHGGQKKCSWAEKVELKTRQRKNRERDSGLQREKTAVCDLRLGLEASC